ncbi:MAG TPA: chemotaxis protein CheW [Vicinamibacterales bacterium]
MSSTSESQATAAPGAEHRDLAAMAGKYLTFQLGKEEYGLPVLKVREIIKLLEITPVPQAPPHVKGVINLRGKVIPVIDLRLKFQLPFQEYDARTAIIVVEVVGINGPLLMGIIVDTVSEVLNITADEIEGTPDFGEHVRTDYMRGVAKVKGTVKILLDLDRAFAEDAGMASQAA